MAVSDYRISKVREYLFNIINTLTENRNYQINANMLSNKIDDYSLDKIPTSRQAEPNWIIGVQILKDTFAFRSRKNYSVDAFVNLKNIGFFEDFENIINSNNEKGVLPEIDGIEKIECLNSGTLLSLDDGNKAQFEIQIQITYRYVENSQTNPSL